MVSLLAIHRGNQSRVNAGSLRLSGKRSDQAQAVSQALSSSQASSSIGHSLMLIELIYGLCTIAAEDFHERAMQTWVIDVLRDMDIISVDMFIAH